MRVSWRAAALLLAATAVLSAGGQRPVRWPEASTQPAVWYATDDARRIADTVLLHQRASGGWPKNTDMTAPPSAPAPSMPDSTIDNGATTTEIRFLARVAAAATRGSEKYRAGVIRGIDYLLAAQYANGGWPQVFPVRRDYSRHITFNDDAMVNVLTLLEEVARGQAPFGFIDEPRRARAAQAVTKGTAVILAAQVIVNTRRTAWGAQHDEVTLEPRPARAFEPVALTAHESVGIVRLLMQQPRTPDIVRAVDAAVAWLKTVRLPDGRWSRFYEIGTNRPIFAGRDGIVRYRVEEIEKERQEGYAWFGRWARDLVEREHPAWKTGSH